MFSFLCYVGSIHLIMGLHSFNLAPGPSGKKKQPTKQKNAQTENHLSARWHQWSKKVKAHPAPLFCSFISDNTLPLFLLFSKPTTHLFFSIFRWTFSALVDPTCVPSIRRNFYPPPKRIPHPFCWCVLSFQRPAATWRRSEEWYPFGEEAGCFTPKLAPISSQRKGGKRHF